MKLLAVLAVVAVLLPVGLALWHVAYHRGQRNGTSVTELAHGWQPATVAAAKGWPRASRAEAWSSVDLQNHLVARRIHPTRERPPLPRSR